MSCSFYVQSVHINCSNSVQFVSTSILNSVSMILKFWHLKNDKVSAPSRHSSKKRLLLWISRVNSPDSALESFWAHLKRSADPSRSTTSYFQRIGCTGLLINSSSLDTRLYEAGLGNLSRKPESGSGRAKMKSRVAAFFRNEAAKRLRK